MTQEEALEILKNSNLVKQIEKPDRTLYRQIGVFVRETDHSFCWAVHFYSSINPLDLTYAFACFVDKVTKEVSHSSAPLPKEFLKELQSSSNHV